MKTKEREREREREREKGGERNRVLLYKIILHCIVLKL